MNWIPWGAEKPRDMEVFLGSWGGGQIQVVRLVRNSATGAEEIRLHHPPVIGCGPMETPPIKWLRLPELNPIPTTSHGGEAA